MRSQVVAILNGMLARHCTLQACREDILAAFTLLRDCFAGGGKLLVCGNGGSAADSEHIIGELMKGFLLSRPIPKAARDRLIEMYPQRGEYLCTHLQRALPAIALTSHTALSTAFANDVAVDMSFAQQVLGYAQHGDILLAISTSGNSENVANAVMVAKAMRAGTIALTGVDGGMLAGLCDVAIRVPERETYLVQESHLPIYHALCAMLENEFFGPDIQFDRPEGLT